MKNSFEKATLPNYYRVEVIQCSDAEVAYSYQMKCNEENTIIPCAGRVLPIIVIRLKVKFTRMFTKRF